MRGQIFRKIEVAPILHFLGPIDAVRFRLTQNFNVKSFKALAMIEISKVCQFVAEGVDETGVFEWFSRRRMPQTNLYSTIAVANAVVIGFIALHT